ncbi:TPA: Eco57I restriction-modification methylase domain-containing protein [Campylobacter coli]|uniref:site-specific DNA-methyltransferase (adenine-specific) n=1 Tax=Campylobacter coli TaxID=195 RepID=A0A6C7TDA8_CAMCO|nr:Eco57I restriction-modification methylase domain-containing protein [Campylobacter coli]ECR2423635.1 class I SAM-dependent DNA methyltransferase [Campylobacter coli]ECR3119887.1 class I SAM-dependent DNA methyltransferase [Campylobacter coli]MDN2740658.1 Eco57I restriction-modification methylase domain-containing protein [Campylobacter coli]HEF9062052.1 Eco57I restriction-modification methylase domain-containing protein [Campylobacter coli]HEF9067602.1 Eco57I restriction-modification methyl
MKFEAIDEKEFLNPYYRKKPILEAELNEFIKALKDYKTSLENNLKNNEDSLVANALSKFFENLHFECEIKSIHKGNSGMDLALKKDKQIQVIVEAKLPHSKEFFSQSKPNCKALHECILYYLRERKALNSSLKHIIITDFYRFYIFKADLFEELFNKNKYFKEAFENFESKNSLFKGNTDEFYKECEKLLSSEKYLDSITRKDLFDEPSLKGVFIDIKPILEQEKPSFSKLKPLFKIFHKDFLLSEFNPNDANSLNNAFYKELLYILGLCESKQNSKLIIAKSEESKEEQGTFYTAINSKLKEENFETILKLLILWLNRILFLKLIESNLVRFNDDKNLKFLNFKKIPDFDKLSELFFEVLAKEKSTRKKSEFAYLPYLNSSLFEKQSIENTLEISSLSNDLKLFYYKNTVLKDDKCKAKKGQVGLLEYLFEFLDSFDFGSDDEQSEILSQKELISSSVLGNVFEKLNGYKEGSFYTPSFITSYMCKESITKVVLDKFNAQFDLDAKDISELRKSLRKEDKKAQKELLNSIKICDPAVGSGHFLVSALNVMLSIYDELNLFDEEFYLEVQNDEILITNHKGEFIEYKRPSTPKDKAHLIQQELFHTKKDIIENNLFGVDINPNSCEITKLRLWIELLKHSFYQSFDDENYHDLKTLPNIDINIKCGNSLVSYFETGKSLSHYPNIKERINKYKRIVKDYKEGFYIDKNLIAKEIKNLQESFKNFCLKDKFNKEIKQLTNGANEYSKKYGDFLADEHHDEKFKSFFSKNMFEFSFDEKEATKEFANLKKEYDNIFNLESNHPFEWRFEFPEILDDDGNFKGFDLIIGNPPYIRQEELKELKSHLAKNYKVYKGTSDIYTYFYELGFNVLKDRGGVLSYITSNKYTRAGYGEALREFLLKNVKFLEYTDLNGIKVFDSATVDTSILCFEKSKSKDNKFKYLALSNEILKTCAYDIGLYKDFAEFSQNSLSKESFTFSDENTSALKAKIERIGTPLKEWYGLNIYRGILTGYNEAFIITTEKRNEILANCKDEAEKERTAKLMRKMLRGRDIKRYSYEWAGLWVIGTFPSLKLDIEQYPALKQYLSQFLPRIEQSGEKGCRKKTSNKWFETQDNIAYYEEFEKEKIVYPNMNKEFIAFFDNEFFLLNQKCFILSHQSNNKKELLYLTALLNSNVNFYYFKQIGAKLGASGYEMSKIFVEKLPIPKINSKNQKIADELINSVDEILKAKEQDKNANTQELENKINSLVYKLYNLTEEEIKIIEGK